jgi:protoheme IX farnesyltransferase
VVLFAIIFMWTPPHFWALALFRSSDYAKVGVPMLPVVAGKLETRRQIVIYSVLLFPVTLLPWYLGLAGAVYGISACVLGGLFILASIRVWRDHAGDGNERPAKQMFGYSILYLFLLFALLLGEGIVGMVV